jgi:hypothetical protein
MRAELHVRLIRVLLLCVLIAPSIHCASEDGAGPQACDSCDCSNVPDDDDSSAVDDDDSAVDDDDSAADDDDDSAPSDDDDSSVSPEDVTLSLEPCAGGVLDAFTDESILPPGSESEEYSVPAGDVLEAIESSVEALVSDQGLLAAAEVAVVGYELCRGEDEEAGIALWRPLQPGTGRALFAWRAVAARPLIVGVPHANFEQLTLEEGVAMFDQLDARALIVTGTHRCANEAAAGCDGNTSVCSGESGPYRESDMAHVEDSVFQVAHEALSSIFEEDIVMSLHGMSGLGISISSGVLGQVADDSFHSLFATELLLSFADEDITSCNPYPGGSTQQRLCGTTNVQGRFVNGSESPCDTPAEEISGRFIHLEQSLEVRQQYDEIIEDLDALLPESD